jgi:hypothetical protein
MFGLRSKPYILVFPVAQEPNWGLGRLIADVSRSLALRHTHTHTYN